MNELRKVESHDITIIIQNVTEFFQIFKGFGTLKREKFVPFLLDEEKRVEWCDGIQLMMKQCNDFYSCFIDEKWVHTPSGRNKEKTIQTARSLMIGKIAELECIEFVKKEN